MIPIGLEDQILTISSGVPTWVTSIDIGQNYGGGIIFYVDGTMQHGLIAAASDQSIGLQWYNGSYVMTDTRKTAVGAGQANTTEIVTVQGAGSYAAKLCDDLVLNGYSDWFLPSKDELNLLYQQRSAVGGFSSDYYWSSSEFGNDNAWYQPKTGTSFEGSNKSNHYRVRAVRVF